MSPQDKISDNLAVKPLRFVHTADLHLDSPLGALSLRDPTLAELVDNATRTTLARIVDLCLEQQVNALLIAGDIYDGDQKSVHTAAAFLFQMRRLHSAGIEVFIIRGNHDAKSGLGSALAMPENVHEFDGRGGSRLISNTKAMVHGVSFSKAHAEHSLLPKFKKPVADHLNIGLLHTSLAGSSKHDVYAPCSVSELIQFGYDYWALGHIHKPQIHNEAPAVVMPGIPQGRDIGEDGEHSVCLVSMSEHETNIERHCLCPVQFEHLAIDIAPLNEWSELIDTLEAALKESRATVLSDQLIARITLTGSSKLSFLIERDIDVLIELCREMCVQIGRCWIETIKNKTSRETSAIDSAEQQGVLTELGTLIQNDILDAEYIHEIAANEARLLIKKLPTELRQILGQTPEAEAHYINELLRNGTQSLLNKLSADNNDAH